jgi:hypothetical protein
MMQFLPQTSGEDWRIMSRPNRAPDNSEPREPANQMTQVPAANHRKPPTDVFPWAEPFSRSIRRVPLPAMLLILAIIFPPEIGASVGGLFLNPYRLVLIISFFPAFIGLISGKVGRLRICDFLMFFYGLWAMIALTFTEGAQVAMQTGGVHALESFGSYVIARRYITSPMIFRGVVALLTVIVISLTVFTVPESITGINILHQAAITVFGKNALDGVSTIPMTKRFGLTRAFGPFEHPIIYGTFCASALGMSWYILAKRERWYGARVFRGFYIVFATFFSVSSGALVSAAIQGACIAWDRIARSIKFRWYLVLGGLAFAYVVMSLFGSRPPIRILCGLLAINDYTGYMRYTMWDYGLQDVWAHPLFGIGTLHQWDHPAWMSSKSLDAFWLLEAMRFGLVASFCLIGSIVSVAFGLIRMKKLPDLLDRCRKGWIMSILGFVTSGVTVHFWNAIFVYLCFMVGMCVFVLNYKPKSEANALARRKELLKRAEAARQNAAPMAARTNVGVDV